MNDLITPPAPTDAESALSWLRKFGLDACEFDDRTAVELALEHVPTEIANTDAACLAVRAALRRYEGQVDKTLDLFERALRVVGTDAALEVQIREYLAVIYYLRTEITVAEEMLDIALQLAPEDVRLIALRATFRARRSDSRALDDIDFVSRRASTLPDLYQARAFIRICGASYHLGNVSLAEKYAQTGVERAEEARAGRQAATGYHILSSIYSNDVGDIALSLHYADLCASAALKAGDKPQWLIILISRYSIAAETGDRVLVEDTRRQLEAHRGAEKYNERVTLVASDALSYGWDQSYNKMGQYLDSVNLDRATVPQKALCYSLRAVAAIGVDDEKTALKFAYLALSMARPTKKDPLQWVRFRLLARTVSGAVLIRANRNYEAERHLQSFQSRANTSIRALMQAVVDDDYGNIHTEAPDLLGWGLLLDALKRKNERNLDAHAQLTNRELEILRACAIGSTTHAIAEKLRIDEATVSWHRGNILKKLSVNRTTAAIAKGRDLGLIP